MGNQISQNENAVNELEDDKTSTVNTESEITEKEDPLYEIVEKKNYDELEANSIKKDANIDSLHRLLYEQDEIIKNLKYEKDVLENKNKICLKDFVKLKEKYDDLEYEKLDIEEKYLEQLHVVDSIDYLKKKIYTLENDYKIEIVRNNEEKEKNNDLNKIVEREKKKVSELLKNNKNILNKIIKKLNHFSCKKELYNYLEQTINEEPHSLNTIIDNIINSILKNIIYYQKCE